MKERIRFLLKKKIGKISKDDNLSLNAKQEKILSMLKEIDKSINDWYIKLSTYYEYWYSKTHKIRDALKNNNDFSEILDVMSDNMNNYVIDELMKDIL